MPRCIWTAILIKINMSQIQICIDIVGNFCFLQQALLRKKDIRIPSGTPVTKLRFWPSHVRTGRIAPNCISPALQRKAAGAGAGPAKSGIGRALAQGKPVKQKNLALFSADITTHLQILDHPADHLPRSADHAGNFLLGRRLAYDQ